MAPAFCVARPGHPSDMGYTHHMTYKTYTCPISKRCGGCEWLAVPYPIQLRRKQEDIRELFGDILREDRGMLRAIVGMDQPIRYRAKAATPFAPGPHGKGVRFGFYAAHTHQIVTSEDCLVEYPGARNVLHAVARAAEWVGVPAYDEDKGTGVLRHAVVRCGYATDDILLTVVTNGPRLPRESKFVREILRHAPQVTSIVQNENDRRTNAILGTRDRVLHGPGVIHDRLLGCTFEIGPTSFYQTNPEQTERLYRIAIDSAHLHEGDNVLDTYCGTGTIGICAASLARKAGHAIKVIGVERSGEAVGCARRNAQANNLGDSCRFVRQDATDYMTRAAGRQTFDVVIMDPPRAGSTPQFIRGIARLAPRRVVYVSCNPKTQVRDLLQMRQEGYRLESLTPVDMFPHTRHIETVAVLVR